MYQQPRTSPEQPDAGRRWHPWRWLLGGLLGALLLLVLLVLAVVMALRSDTGTAWVIEQIPGLTVEQGAGSLLGRWRADRLRWQGYGVYLDVETPVLDWSPTCLLRKTLCLDQLHAASLDLRLTPAEQDEAPSGIRLPALEIPLSIRLSDVRLGPMTVNDGRIWDRVELDAGGSGASWELARALYRFGDYRVEASGRVETRGDWPVDLQVLAALPPPSGAHWRLALGLTGNVEDVRVTGTSQGYLDATLEGRVAPLEPELPARLTVRSERFLALDTLPDTLTLQQTRLEAQGSLADGFRARGQSVLPGTTGPVELRLGGLITLDGVADLDLTLVTPKEPTGRVTLAGDLGWRDGFRAAADMDLDGFPWYTLLPGLEPPPVVLQTLTGHLNWHNGAYQAELAATTGSPLGPARVTARVDGNLDQLRVPELALETDAGALKGQATVGLGAVLSWQAALELANFNPGFWVPGLEASLNGRVSTEGKAGPDAAPELAAQWDLTGQWRKQDTVARGRLNADDGWWSIAGLELWVGNNRVTGSGRLGETALTGDLTLRLPAPEQLLPGLKGQLEAQLTASGSPKDPTGRLTLSGQSLAWRNQAELESVSLVASLAAGQVASIRAEATKVRSAGQALESVNIRADGTQSRHQLSLDAVHKEAILSVGFEGGFGEHWQTWAGALSRARITLPDQDQQWRLQAPADLTYQRQAGALLFGAHCWVWQSSSVCADDQQLLPQPRIVYRIQQFPAAALAPVLPDNLRWLSDLNAEINVTLTDAGPNGRLWVDAGEGRFEVLMEDRWESLDYRAFTVDMGLKPEQASLAVELAGDGVGELNLTMAIDPRDKDRRVTGDFRVQGLELALIGGFTSLEEVAGEVSGQGTLSGPLLKPSVTGLLTLIDGRVMDPSLPIPMEEIAVDLSLQGYSAEIDGFVRSNERSQTLLTGHIDWSGAPTGSIAIKGSRVPLNVEPYAVLELAPDLTVSFQDQTLKIAGTIDVPRGDVEIKGLPSQAVRVSEDEEIVGAAPRERAVRALNMDISVVVGEDRVSFAAFGVTGNLEGRLRIGNDLDTRGTLELVDGSFEAYGQELQLRKARLLFVGNLNQPYLDIEAIRRVDTVVAGLRMTGPVQSPTSEVFSNPELPETSALSYLILGRAPESQGDEGQMSQAALSLGLTQASKITGEIGEQFGIRDLVLEAEGSGEQTSVVASGYITEDLSLRYGVGVFEPITTLKLRYDLGEYFYLEAASGLAASLDIFYTRDF